MAVIVSNGDTNLSTASGFYRAEAYNMPAWIFSSSQALTTVYSKDVTFANAGNLQGVIAHIESGNTACDKGVTVGLLENKGTFTITIASPGVITLAGHGFSGGEEFIATTTGTLPTGITASTVRYYVKYVDANTFKFATTVGGSDVNTSGTQSGTHTLWVTRTKDDFASSYFIPSTSGYSGIFSTMTAFPFTTPYAIDTNANKWRIYLKDYGGSTGAINWASSSVTATDVAYIAWCDNAVSFTNNDVLVCKDVVTIDQTATVKGVLPTGRTDLAPAVIICSTTNDTEDTISKLKWQTSPASSYTFTVDGNIVMGTWTGMQIGTSANPIPYAQQAILELKVPTVGTNVSGPTCLFGSSTSRPFGRNSIIMYGEIPTYRSATLSVDAELLQDKITLTQDLSAQWQVGDRIVVGRQNVKGQGSTTVNTISSFSGAQITLNANIATYKRYANASVINLSRGYGIMVRCDTTGAASSRGLFYVSKSAFFKVSGVYFRDTYFTNLSYYSTYGNAFDNYGTKYEINDNLSEYTQTTGVAILYGQDIIPPLGIDLKRNLCFRSQVLGGVGANYTTVKKSGTMTVEDNISLMVGSTAQAGGSIGTNNTKINYTNNKWENGSISFVMLTGRTQTLTGNLFWGCSNASGTLTFATLALNPTMSDNYYENNTYAFGWQSAGFVVDAVSNNDTFGQTVANTYDILYLAGAYGTFFINDSVGTINENLTSISDTVSGSRVGITTENGVANKTRSTLTEGYYTKTGAGLSDTTVHTAGGFALRFEPNVVELAYEQIIPTGDIGGLTMTVNVWCKINSANYYSGTYVTPKLTINYDNGTTTSASATNTTSWQLLSASFTPSTSYGQITVTLTAETDQTGTNAYVYWDDMGVLFPAGVTLNLGSMDLWATGQPISPMIATGVNANDVWAVDKTTLTATDSIGEHVASKLAKVSDVEPLY